MVNMSATIDDKDHIYYEWEMFPIISEFPWVVKLNYKSMKSTNNKDSLTKKIKNLGFNDFIVYPLLTPANKLTQYWELRFKKEVDLITFKELKLHEV